MSCQPLCDSGNCLDVSRVRLDPAEFDSGAGGLNVSDEEIVVTFKLVLNSIKDIKYSHSLTTLQVAHEIMGKSNKII